jgi:lipopolysaccharide/colanic/teichoic acid biosynthesis glycosyltransferase
MSGQRAAYDRVKRVLDVGGAIVVLLASLPVQAVVGALIALQLGRPILFRQTRPGRDGVLFEMVKFRTMLPADPARGFADDRDRMTSLGRVLRATSLDELPTLLNVIKGDMSMVGPRPLLVTYLERYTPEQARRHEVRPGITGLAQINGRNAISWQRKLAYDVEYVDNRSFRLDAWILWRTVGGVLSRAGITAEGEATTREFLGERTGDDRV